MSAAFEEPVSRGLRKPAKLAKPKEATLIEQLTSH
jgi:hypothetical protein